MKALINLSMAAVLVVVGGVADAQAGTIKLSGAYAPFQTPPQTAPGGITAPNDVIPKLWGYLGGNLVLDGTAGAEYLVEFTLIGSESGWTNTLKETQGNTALTEPAHSGQTISYLHTAATANDLLKFKFVTTGGPLLAPLVNGANGGVGAARSFFVSFCIDPALSGKNQKTLGCNTSGNATSGDIAWLALDDSGAGPNDDHDDWVGYVKVTPVPDGGATAGLISVALLGVAALRRKFTA